MLKLPPLNALGAFESAARHQGFIAAGGGTARYARRHQPPCQTTRGSSRRSAFRSPCPGRPSDPRWQAAPAGIGRCVRNDFGGGSKARLRCVGSACALSPWYIDPLTDPKARQLSRTPPRDPAPTHDRLSPQRRLCAAGGGCRLFGHQLAITRQNGRDTAPLLHHHDSRLCAGLSPRAPDGGPNLTRRLRVAS